MFQGYAVNDLAGIPSDDAPENSLGTSFKGRPHSDTASETVIVEADQIVK